MAEPPAGFTSHGLRHTHASVEATLATYAHTVPNDGARLAAEPEGVFGETAGS